MQDISTKPSDQKRSGHGLVVARFPFWQSLSGNGVELSAVVINDMLHSRAEIPMKPRMGILMWFQALSPDVNIIV